ncbi:EfeM/EfeO family lipoprotein (plasmid) [Exiguobacterium sp. N4-1P]|uniref:Efem/EfeO family lipoprotein n=1 Tax=Exiguobacterium oxidotolerans TaxID=223958 RepID=A0A653I5V9_9BACL|nr:MULTISPECIES: iron uptake system protein EfeO [Exiguobacterium]ASI35497.1 EfeM/EfeO family lipoprotein [Exiguobacterium sp. N4-1P]ASI37506.1 EfeM/EfeO family lipoprotein [Exiguobacterium sp. N4-1P]VWX34438.1 Efem/EfeO family lipoprotein [Exiguobacterium oxidotolerans]
MSHKKILTASVLSLATLLAACGEQETTTKATPKTADGQFDQVVADYRDYAINELDAFTNKTEAFTTAVKEGDLEKAKALYAPARMHYERAEPIAEVFGDLDPKIDARAGDVKESEWGGYHRIEQGLFEKGTTKGYEQYAEQLMQDVHLLRAKVETVDVTPELLVTGATDLLNEVSTSKVTGEEDRYSHTDLYDFAANVQGAEKIYQLLNPSLMKQDDALSKEIAARFEDVNALLEAKKTEKGYVLYTDLSKTDVKQLSQAINELAEPLSKMGIVLEG